MSLMGYKRQVVAQHERALVLKNGMLEQILGPGVYRWLDLTGALEVQVFDLTGPELVHPHAEVFRKESAALWDTWVQTLETGEQEAGLLYLDGRLSGLLPPMSRRFYWKGPVDVRLERIDLAAGLAIDAGLMETIRRLRYSGAWTRPARRAAGEGARHRQGACGSGLPGQHPGRGDRRPPAGAAAPGRAADPDPGTWGPRLLELHPQLCRSR